MSKVVHMKHNNLGADKILITHTDLDGIGCAVIFLKCYPKGNVFFADYDYVDQMSVELLEQFPDADFLFSDISISPVVAEIFNQRGKVGLVDHHRTAEWLTEKYEWATVVQGKCGTRLVYELLSPWFNITDLEPFVDVVESWDLWGNDTYPSEEAVEYQFMFEFLGKRDFLAEALKDTAFPINAQWSWLLDKLLDKYESYYHITKQITQIHMSNGYRVGIALADQYISLMGNRLCDELALEYVMIIDNRHGKASLRGMGNIDLGALAKEAGGGGHRKAAGFKLGYEAAEFVKRVESDG